MKGFVILSVLLALISGCQQPAPKSSLTLEQQQLRKHLEYERQITPPEGEYVMIALTRDQNKAVENHIRSRLKDSSSAVFQGSIATRDKNGVVYACGFVNAKNSFGGYTGNALYAGTFRGDGFHMDVISDRSNIGNTVALNTCRRRGIHGDMSLQ